MGRNGFALLLALPVMASAGVVILALSSSHERAPRPERVVMMHSDYAASPDVAELKAKNEYVLIGKVVKVVGTQNLARDHEDPSRESRDFIIPGTNYEVLVERYLKGKGSDRIIVSVRGGEMKGLKVVDDADVQPVVGGRYLWFLRAWPPGAGMFTGNTFPNRFRLINGEARVEGSDEAKKVFSPMTERELISSVERAP